MKKTLLALGAALALTSSLAMAQPAPGAVPPPPVGKMVDQKGPPSFKETTREEHIKRAADRFDEMDANKDGKLTEAEVRAFFEKRKAEHQGSPSGPGPRPGPAR